MSARRLLPKHVAKTSVARSAKISISDVMPFEGHAVPPTRKHPASLGLIRETRPHQLLFCDTANSSIVNSSWMSSPSSCIQISPRSKSSRALVFRSDIEQ